MLSLSQKWTIESTRLTSFFNNAQPQSVQDINAWIKAVTNQDAIATHQMALSVKATGVLEEGVLVDFASIPQRTDWVFRPRVTVPKVVDGIAPLENIGKCLKRYALVLERLGGWPHANRLALGFSLVLEVESMMAAQAIWMEVLGEAISGGLEATDLIYRINRPINLSRGPLVNKLITYQTSLISVMKILQSPTEAAYNTTPEASGIVCRVDFDINTDADTLLNLDSRSQVKMIGKLIKTALSDVETS